MTPSAIVRAAIPDADDGLVEHIVFGRTPYPFMPLTARRLYKAAMQWRRAGANGRRLCDFCDTHATTHKWLCDGCAEAMQRIMVEAMHKRHTIPR